VSDGNQHVLVLDKALGEPLEEPLEEPEDPLEGPLKAAVGLEALPLQVERPDLQMQRYGPELFATVAHELRGPLMALATSAEVLTDDFDQLDRGDMFKLALGIRCRSLWLQGLVENILCATALGDGRFAIHPRTTDLGALVTEVHLLLEPLLVQRQQTLEFSRGARVPAVAADSRRVGQVLVNLILNASKYSPVGEPIHVSLSRQRGAVRVSVRDRGPGLPEGDPEQLFRPFHRAPIVLAEGKEGVGLGLAIVRAIVEAHGGQAGAQNTPPGATFWFDLPSRPHEQSVTKALPVTATTAGQRGLQKEMPR
jgi:K+-sensing histidine kinase KdpD